MGCCTNKDSQKANIDHFGQGSRFTSPNDSD